MEDELLETVESSDGIGGVSERVPSDPVVLAQLQRYTKREGPHVFTLSLPLSLRTGTTPLASFLLRSSSSR